MIELRWALQHHGHIEKERVLQYRVRKYLDGFGIMPSSFGEWSEWQDVPEVDVRNVPRAGDTR